MSEAKRIKTALVSVYHKEGLDEIITKLHEEGVEFLSTGGTRQFIESLGFLAKRWRILLLILYFGRTCEDTAS